MVLKFLVLMLAWFGSTLESATPVLLSTPGLNAIRPQIGMASNGDALAAFIEDGYVKSRIKLFEQSWGSLVTLSNRNFFLKASDRLFGEFNSSLD